MAPSPPASYLPDQQSGHYTSALTYTSNPISLVLYDISLFFRQVSYIPRVLLPLRTNRRLDELYFSPGNIYNVVFQGVLILFQLLFLLSLVVIALLGPFVPLTYAAVYFFGFIVFNHYLCKLLNGTKPYFESNRDLLADLPAHPKERWIYLNGVAGSHHWLQANLDCLALTFQRPVLGILNPTAGIVFDIVQCLVQRDFGYSTQDVRDAYVKVKAALYDAQYTKVVFIVHSQGAIEGGLIVDWLLDEMPQDLLKQLEVYTFGNAANHFSNPPTCSTTPLDTLLRSNTSENDGSWFGRGGAGREKATAGAKRDNGKVIGHIEHYANSADFVARWGVLNFAKNTPPRPPSSFAAPTSGDNATASSITASRAPATQRRTHANGTAAGPSPRTATGLIKAAAKTKPTNTFMGRVFVRPGSGHLLNQHYLSTMFTRGADGLVAESNAFMDTVLDVGGWPSGANGEVAVNGQGKEAMFIDVGSPVEAVMRGVGGDEVRVKDLSRLWMYRNGGSPLD